VLDQECHTEIRRAESAIRSPSPVPANSLTVIDRSWPAQRPDRRDLRMSTPAKVIEAIAG
jgi:hypothetical protein